MTSIISARPLTLPAGYNSLMKRAVFLFLCLLPYVAYLIVALQASSGPIDFDTFRAIGARLLAHQPIYGENSYYPMPMVMVFSLLALLPRDVALMLWLGLPVLIALAVSGWSPWVLLFAPVFSHFAGGQSAVFGLLGVWAVRRLPDRFMGGALLALATLKPHLAIVPLAWLLIQWGRGRPEIKRSLIGFISVSLLIWLPTFLIYPGWIHDWLASLRPVSERGLAGIIPRAMIHADNFMVSITILIITMILAIWIVKKGFIDRLDVWMFGAFIASPFFHDYDLIQLVPVLDDKTRRLAVVASIPMWLTILTAYPIDSAWWTAAVIAPMLLLYASEAKIKDE